MKAMVLRKCAPVEEAPLVWTDVDDPVPGPGEVRVKVKACGVCRTDLHVIEGELPERDHPVIPGHMIVGEVDQLGPGADRFRPGDRVGIAWLRHTCGECRFCRSGSENLCEHMRFTGYHEPGGYAEMAKVHQDFAYVIPPVFSDVDAAPLLCAGIIGFRALKRAGVKRGDALALYGFGASAHVVIQVAAHWGCRVRVVSRTEEHLELARSLGAEWAGTKAHEMPGKADAAIIFAPAGRLVPVALENLEKGGTLALAGIYMTEIPAMDYEKHLFHEKNIHSVEANTRADGEELIATAAEIPIRPEVQVFAMKDANTALLRLKRSQVRGSAVLVP